ncbi:MAG TPA: CHAD domain-containing protein, partial [Burkholderiaceae bacterium]|nr:CHAD domain-containing protein [Burkholderiaceae bacterium]
GLALRVRREGAHWVQTLKGSGDDALTRFEHNVRVYASAAGGPPPADPALHRGTAVGDRLLALLGHEGAATLNVRYRTDVLRRTRTLRSGGATIELAFDSGTIRAGDDASWPLCELELELANAQGDAGDPAALIELGRTWARRHHLWLDTRSKSERGELLARGTRIAPARTAQKVVLTREMSPHAAWRAVLRECVGHIAANASQIASGEHGDEHVHQLRVALRRLRTAGQLFDFMPSDPAQLEAAAALFRGLGVARDQAVAGVAFSDDLERAFERLGVPRGLGDAKPTSAAPGGREAADPCTLVRAQATQMLLLGLIAASMEPDAAIDAGLDEEPLAERLARRIKRWHKRAAADALRFAELDDTQRHRLRKHVKRLRYAVEFSAGLFERGQVKRYLKPLRALQEQLGTISDVIVAMHALPGTPDRQVHDWFALGWLSARRDALVQQAAAPLQAFAKVQGFWRAR